MITVIQSVRNSINFNYVAPVVGAAATLSIAYYASSIFSQRSQDQFVDDLVGKVKIDSTYKLTEQDKATFKDALKRCHEKLKAISSDSLKSLFKTLLSEDLSVEKSIEAFLGLCDESVLLPLSDVNEQDVQNLISAEALLRDKAVQSVWLTKARAYWKELQPEISRFFHHMMDLVITVLGFNQIGDDHEVTPFAPSMSSFEANAKWDLYAKLLTYPPTLFAFYCAYTKFSAAALAAAFASVSIGISFVCIYMRFLRPCPHHCSGTENLSDRGLRQENEPLYWDIHGLDSILQILSQKQGVILVGDPGAGKTQAVKAFVEYMLSGECVDKNFEDMQVFELLFNKQMGHSFNTVREKFKDYPKKTMFFIDEIHELFQKDKKYGNKQIDDLKKFYNDFSSLIGTTTRTEYKEYVAKDPAILRRFQPIFLDPPSDNEIKVLLHKVLEKYAQPELIKEKGIIDHIISRALELNSNTTKIDAAKSLLSVALSDAQNIPFRQGKLKMIELKQQIESLKTAVGMGEVNAASELVKNQSNYQKLVQELKQNEIQLAEIKRIEQLYRKIKVEEYVMAARIAEKKIDFEAGKKIWLAKKATIKILEAVIQDRRKDCGLTPALNKALIDMIIQRSIKQKSLPNNGHGSK